MSNFSTVTSRSSTTADDKLEAGKGFVTPFNRFGSKGAIMHALSGRVIDRMEARFRAEAPAGDAIDRTLAMGRTAAACLLERPVVYKAVVGTLGTARHRARCGFVRAPSGNSRSAT